jgi:hypothetical protein
MIQKIAVTSGTLLSIVGIGWLTRVIRQDLLCGDASSHAAFLSEQT